MKTTNHLSTRKPDSRSAPFLRSAVVLLVLIFSAPVLNATSLSFSTPPSRGSEKIIRNYFKFPQVLIPHAEFKNAVANKVEVFFTTDRTGNVNFALAKTADTLLKTEVERQFYKLRLPKLATDVVHSVVLNFKTM